SVGARLPSAAARSAHGRGPRRLRPDPRGRRRGRPAHAGVSAAIAIGPADPRYPPRLRDLAHPPDPLWVRGEIAVPLERAVSIVGTRRATGYGLRVARELAAAAAAAGIV